MNSTYRYKAGGFSSLAQALNYAAKSPAKLRFFDAHGKTVKECSYQELRQKSLQLAYHLREQGFKRGSYVAIIAQTRLEFHIVFFACQYAGLIPSPLPATILPAGQKAYEEKLQAYLELLKPALLVSPANMKEIAQNTSKTCHATVASYEDLLSAANSQPLPNKNTPIKGLNANEIAYIQFSSGSTSEPGGLLITQQALMANLNAIAKDGNDIRENEQTFSWLPFDHNMGLVSFVLSPVNTQSNVDYITPGAFMAQPQLWLELMSACRSTLTFAPAFAYDLALQKRDHDKKLDLSALRVAGIGADMIQLDALHRFADEMRDTGFQFKAFSPGYGLTEMVMAVSISKPEKSPYTCKDPHHPKGGKLISCGRVLPGYEVKIIPENALSYSGQHLCIGQVWVKGPSLVTHSLNEKRKPMLDQEGFLATGDLGFLKEGHLFITGRLKDMIIIRGRNIWAQDVEWTVMKCAPVLHSHDVVAIGITQNHEEQLVILLQHHSLDKTGRAELSQTILRAINQSLGIKAHIIWVQPHQLATTSAGKLSRTKIKQDYLDGKLAIMV